MVSSDKILKNKWFVNHCEDFFGEASFWASENYTGLVGFESRSSEWRVLSKFIFQH